MGMIDKLANEIKEKEALKNHIKEQALAGKRLILRPEDVKRLADIVSDWRDGMKYKLDNTLMCAWCGGTITHKYTKDENGDVYHAECVTCVTEEDLLNVQKQPEKD